MADIKIAEPKFSNNPIELTGDSFEIMDTSCQHWESMPLTDTVVTRGSVTKVYPHSPTIVKTS